MRPRSDNKTLSDTDLLTAMAGGDDLALKEIFNRYKESLFARARHFLCNQDAAMDCVQEVFISLWKRPDKTAIKNLDHYLHQAVRFRALIALRDNKAGDTFDSRVYELDRIMVTESPLELKELKLLIDSWIASLPADQQRIFLLHREQQLTYKQIADKLGISVKTVEKKMTLSLRSLRVKARNALILLIVLSQHP